ncbi:hypothetical protein MAPG_10720 [Magnaporthiopsis poae ATCC 64411]|uniref:Uncharacterized protein n=1 Tax=Magnaporthiopsis poae (strain ATCC 64411 / 73-15) TaxID=644358 RepID=A0A0C4EDC5_MAGP6|nr:hypothetical protein MAPG_10720 [Magnaporthiopsis poae ATCC 64411]
MAMAFGERKERHSKKLQAKPASTEAARQRKNNKNKKPRPAEDQDRERDAAGHVCGVAMQTGGAAAGGLGLERTATTATNGQPDTVEREGQAKRDGQKACTTGGVYNRRRVQQAACTTGGVYNRRRAKVRTQAEACSGVHAEADARPGRRQKRRAGALDGQKRQGRLQMASLQPLPVLLVRPVGRAEEDGSGAADSCNGMHAFLLDFCSDATFSHPDAHFCTRWAPHHQPPDKPAATCCALAKVQPGRPFVLLSDTCMQAASAHI